MQWYCPRSPSPHRRNPTWEGSLRALCCFPEGFTVDFLVLELGGWARVSETELWIFGGALVYYWCGKNVSGYISPLKCSIHGLVEEVEDDGAGGQQSMDRYTMARSLPRNDRQLNGNLIIFGEWTIGYMDIMDFVKPKRQISRDSWEIANHASAEKSKDLNGERGISTLAVDSPVISEQTPIGNDDKPDIEKGTQSDVPRAEQITMVECVGADKQGSAVVNASTDPGKSREEQAAIRAQAAFRGYLITVFDGFQLMARRAFRALKGIIRLQALIRGHLVRRQAVATLHCMWGIVKFQAIVRGRTVRRDIEFEVKRSFRQAKDVRHMGSSGANLSSHKGKISVNAFVCKLLSSPTIVKPLDLHYNNEEPNLVWSWLERWTVSLFWKPPPQPKKVLDSKPPGRHYAMETESGRSKRSVRRNYGANIEAGSNNVSSEPEKPKRNPRKVSSHPTDPVQENPQSELERVKRNLRKVSSAMAEASDRVELDMEKPKRSMQKVSNLSDNLDQGADATEKVEKSTGNLAVESKNVENTLKRNIQKVAGSSDIDQGVKETTENAKKDDVPTTPISQDVETVETIPPPVLTDSVDDAMIENQPEIELNSPESTEKIEKFTPANGEHRSKEEDASHENHKSSKRRASFSAKAEYTENGVQNTPKLPSYMAATESAKAKLRGQNSPRFGADEIDKNGFTRRHSLPSSVNGKLNSLSPRTQRLVQASGKGGLRNDRSLLSSRDGNAEISQFKLSGGGDLSDQISRVVGAAVGVLRGLYGQFILALVVSFVNRDVYLFLNVNLNAGCIMEAWGGVF
ncbi:hypothetical protein Taro_002930 [Colocasia esculenta]|uniref:DUF4005 domain-containing protein n=1 Tax=Colocasia esculenta TaxID=4460 RepID=A0A843TK90_COLES|nr:hypothetical protein [Colocasia esculenta]